MLRKLRHGLSRRDKKQHHVLSAPTITVEGDLSSSTQVRISKQSSVSPHTSLLLHSKDASPISISNAVEPSIPPTSYETNTLGLQIIHQPTEPPVADIIFVHGLAGHCYKTWSHNRKPEFFWPGLWLPKDPCIKRARLFTYGYASEVLGPKSVENILGFARALLFDLRHARDNAGNGLQVGHAPIIFVAHSMGGLVVKKACLLAQVNEQYLELSTSISGIVFLSTPHRGSNLANTLSWMLNAALQSERKFVKELSPSSSAIEDINEQFRYIAPRLSIISFYETLATPIAGKGVQIVTKDSAVLGYHAEEVRPLAANHHTVCKFESNSDTGYKIVRDTISGLVEKLAQASFRAPGDGTLRLAEDVRKLLAIPRPTDAVLNDHSRRRVPGTCSWMIDEPVIRPWLEDNPASHIVWYHALPGSGKSILSSYMVHYLQSNGYNCQYYFFSFRDQLRRSVNGMQKSLAYQISAVMPGYGKELLTASTEEFQVDKNDHLLLWQRLFGVHVFNKSFPSPMFWVIDGVDESESPEAIVDLMKDLSRSKTTIKVLLTGRYSESLALKLRKLQPLLKVDIMDGEGGGQPRNCEDIRLLIDRNIDFVPGSAVIKRQLQGQILERARGNFLWTCLVLEELQACQTESEIQATLEQIPQDMAQLYERMELSVTEGISERRIKLAKEVLEWIVCVPRPLTLDELTQAISTNYKDVLDLKRTIREACGQFVIVDGTGHVTMLHQTAREFLSKASKSVLAIDAPRTHGTLLVKTLSVLCGLRLSETVPGSTAWMHPQQKFEELGPFMLYAADSWIYHLRHADSALEEVFAALKQFFGGICVLDWMYTLSTANQLQTLTAAGEALLNFAAVNRGPDASRNMTPDHLSALEFVESWAQDLMRIARKFSIYLVSQPSAIYDIVPAMCPPKSAIYRQMKHSKLALCGQSESWNDVCARLSLSQHDIAMRVIAQGPHIAVLAYGGKVCVWSSTEFGEICVLNHNEAVSNMCMNAKGDMIATYGRKTTKIWDIPSGTTRFHVSNPCNSEALSLMITVDNEQVLVATGNGSIRHMRLKEDEATWEDMDFPPLKQKDLPPSMIVNKPSYMSISPDGTHVGVCYRSSPLTIWNLTSASVVSRCMRPVETLDSSQTWFPVEFFAWNSVTGHIVGWYKACALFKWHPLTDETTEVEASSVTELAVRPDGKIFVTSDSNGTVKVWNFATFTTTHQLSSADLVSGLAFSPDSTRFYDIRGPTITTWEPETLTRLADSGAPLLDNGTGTPPEAMTSYVAKYASLKVLAVSPNGLYFATGNETGEVHLTDIRNAFRMELTRFKNSQPIICLSWSPSSDFIAVANLFAEIQIIRLKMSTQERPNWVEIKRFPGPKSTNHGIYEMLLDCDSTRLLILSDDFAQIWDVTECEFKSSTLLEASQRIWLNHATNDDLFIGVGPEDVQIRQWSNLQQVCLFTFSHRQLSSTLQPEAPNEEHMRQPKSSDVAQSISVQRAMFAQDGKHILVHVKERPQRDEIEQRVFVMPTNSVSVPADDAGTYLHTCLHVTNEMAQRIDSVLGILPDGRIVFLDRHLWLCSIPMTRLADENSLKRHYFIPRDWTDVRGFQQCAMSRNGTVFCPQDGHVVTIRSHLGGIIGGS